jgi:hypothetical protein
MNTQSEVVDDQAQRYASLAANGVIDKSGKLVSREDFVLQTSGFAGTVEQVYTHRNNDGTETIMSVAAGKVYSGTGTFTQRYDYSGTSTTLNNVQFASLTSKIYGMQKGVAPFVLNESTFATEAFTGAPWSNSPNVVIAAAGRLWAADDETGGNRHTVWWSNLLDGKVWNSGDAGSLDVREAWPKGQDQIIALAFLSGRLVIFGRNSILLYTLPADNDPADMALTDSIEGIGCSARDSVYIAGGDLYFLHDSGVHKIPKLAQVTSLLSIIKVSALVADDVVTTFAAEDLAKVRAGYFPREKFLVLGAPTSNKTWCFHLDRNIPDLNVPAVTYWTNVSVPFRGFCYDKSGNWYCATTNGIAKYTGYTPDGAGNVYSLDWYPQWTHLDDETRLKHLKSVAFTVETDIGQVFTARWQLDYKEGTTRTATMTADSADFAEAPGIGVIRTPIGGSGNVFRVGFTTTINSDKVTLHSSRVYANPGATKTR